MRRLFFIVLLIVSSFLCWGFFGGIAAKDRAAAGVPKLTDKDVGSVLEYFPVKDKAAFLIWLFSSEVRLNPWGFSFQEIDQNKYKVTVSAELRGTMYLLVAKSGIYLTRELADLEEKKQKLFLPSRAKIGGDWVFEDVDEKYTMSFFERVPSCLGRYGDFIVLRIRQGNSTVFDVVLEKDVGPVYIRYFYKMETSRPSFGIGISEKIGQNVFKPS